jgi:hypothetical protein
MAESANFEMNTFNKINSGSILRCLEMPHAPYLNVVHKLKSQQHILAHLVFSNTKAKT